jgi:hypothetical protein
MQEAKKGKKRRRAEPVSLPPSPYFLAIGVGDAELFLFDPLARAPTAALADAAMVAGITPNLLPEALSIDPLQGDWAVARGAAFFLSHSYPDFFIPDLSTSQARFCH